MVLQVDALKRVDLDELLDCSSSSDLWLLDGLFSPDTLGEPSIEQTENGDFHVGLPPTTAPLSFTKSVSFALMPRPVDEPTPFVPAANFAASVLKDNNNKRPASPHSSTPVPSGNSSDSGSTSTNGPPPAKRRRNTITAEAVRDALMRTEQSKSQSQSQSRAQVEHERTTAPQTSVNTPTATLSPSSAMSSPGTPLVAPANVASLEGVKSESEGAGAVAPGVTVFAGKPMTKDELLKLENKLEKNRQMAKEARRRKKEYLQTLEDKIKHYEMTIGSLQQRLAESDRLNATLTAELALAQAALGTTPSPASTANPPANNTSTGAPGNHHHVNNSNNPMASLLNMASAQLASSMLHNLGPALLPLLASSGAVGNNIGLNVNHMSSRVPHSVLPQLSINVNNMIGATPASVDANGLMTPRASE